MAELVKQEIIGSDIPEQNILEMYKKSHNSYLPAEQVKRQYEIMKFIKWQLLTYILDNFKLNFQI